MWIVTAAASFLVMVIAIYILSIVTDEFFITSLDKISEVLKLPENVAGASLMAMGSSAPELAIAMLALFSDGGEHSDVGIGTIVGSAVFNILVITGVSAIARPAKVTLAVVVRDCLVYLISISLLLYAFSDGVIYWFEAFLFLVMYAVYIIILFQWNKWAPEDLADETAQIEGPVPTMTSEAAGITGVYHTVTGYIERALGLLTGDAEKNYVRAFFVSILFIGLISKVLVDGAIIFAGALSIPPVIVALTLLAGGTSVPDLIASVIVARQGRGEMAIANAIGSNIFDILICLGLPWIIALTFMESSVVVGTADLWTSTIILLSTVFILFIFLYTDRLLSRTEGYILVGLYVIFVLWTWLV